MNIWIIAITVYLLLGFLARCILKHDFVERFKSRSVIQGYEERWPIMHEIILDILIIVAGPLVWGGTVWTKIRGFNTGIPFGLRI